MSRWFPFFLKAGEGFGVGLLRFAFQENEVAFGLGEAVAEVVLGGDGFAFLGFGAGAPLGVGLVGSELGRLRFPGFLSWLGGGLRRGVSGVGLFGFSPLPCAENFMTANGTVGPFFRFGAEVILEYWVCESAIYFADLSPSPKGGGRNSSTLRSTA